MLLYTGYSEKHSTVWNACHYGMTSGKSKGSATGRRNVRGSQLSKQHTLCKMVYSVEHMFTVKTF